MALDMTNSGKKEILKGSLVEGGHAEIEDDKTEPGSIIQEIQAGYMLGERLLRPALVSVSKRKDKKNEENKDK